MAAIRVIYDREGESLVVWFDEPAREAVARETEDDDLVLMKDARGRVIGIERLNFDPGETPLSCTFEAAG
ncbi:MAG: DUF2283 domain-containing protein [Dehalococcoidia bacterium]|nr:DUF2283 domain-containing protein [Dehalococcoidia bacterium]